MLAAGSHQETVGGCGDSPHTEGGCSQFIEAEHVTFRGVAASSQKSFALRSKKSATVDAFGDAVRLQDSDGEHVATSSPDPRRSCPAKPMRVTQRRENGAVIHQIGRKADRRIASRKRRSQIPAEFQPMFSVIYAVCPMLVRLFRRVSLLPYTVRRFFRRLISHIKEFCGIESSF